MSVDRGFTWMDDETLALIGIFSKDEIQQELNGSKRNIGVYERIASKLADVGFMRTAYQCREKIKRLRKEYHLNKYCMANNITAKKPMKYFDLVVSLFDSESPTLNLSSASDLNITSDSTEELHFNYNPDSESNGSNIFVPNVTSNHQSNCSSPEQAEDQSKDSFSANPTNEDDFLLNENSNYDLSDKDSEAGNSGSPWVPSVLLIENEPDSQSKPFSSSEVYNASNDEEETQDHPNSSYEEKDIEEPPPKKIKKKSNQPWLKKMLDGVTETFLNYQETAESRFLEKITALEQERMKRDESMQKLWLESEERRRREEQQHELKMLSILSQFMQHTNNCNSS